MGVMLEVDEGVEVLELELEVKVNVEVEVQMEGHWGIG